MNATAKENIFTLTSVESLVYSVSIFFLLCLLWLNLYLLFKNFDRYDTFIKFTFSVQYFKHQIVYIKVISICHLSTTAMDDENDHASNQLHPVSNPIDQQMNNDYELVQYPIKLGYAFRCQLPLETLVDQQLIQKYFKDLLYLIEEKDKIYDFHMRLRNLDQDGFTIMLVYKDSNNYSDPLSDDLCVYCDNNNELQQLSLIKENSSTCIWLDTQLRNKLIVTPRQHIQRLSEMSEEDMTQFWYDTKVLLQEEDCDWRSMALNHGKYRKHAHLYMKINIGEHSWTERIVKKYQEKFQLMQFLIENSTNTIK